MTTAIMRFLPWPCKSKCTASSAADLDCQAQASSVIDFVRLLFWALLTFMMIHGGHLLNTAIVHTFTHTFQIYLMFDVLTAGAASPVVKFLVYIRGLLRFFQSILFRCDVSFFCCSLTRVALSYCIAKIAVSRFA